MHKNFFAFFEKYPSCSINALSSIYINNPFLNFGKTVTPLLKENTLLDVTPKKKQNEIVSNLEEPDEIKESTAINLQPLPSQAMQKTKTTVIFHKYLKKVKYLSYLVENKDTLVEALGNLINIWRLLHGAAPKESGISLEPTKAGSRRKVFLSLLSH